MTHYERVINAFHSEMRERHELSPSLERTWFRTAVANYSLDISPLLFDEDTDNFIDGISESAITTLALMISLSYVKREISRVSKLNNIIGRDIQLNATGEAKRAVREEYNAILAEIERKIHKQKRHSFN